MSGQRFALPYETVIGPTGAPLSGALMLFYLTGTSTPANTYADQDLTTPNPNPVVAASNGRFPSIFLDPSITYKVVLQDQTGAQQWAADPVQAPGANVTGYATYTNIAALRAATVGSPTPLVYVEAYGSNAPVGGGWFQYVESDTTSADNGGTIIVDHSSNRYHRLYYGACSIENFGASQDSGLTDSAGAINAALAACTEVLVPGSTSGAWYSFAQPLTIRAGVRLTGAGKTSVLKPSATFGTGAPLLQNASTAPGSLAARDDGIVIENLTIDANSQGSSNVSLIAATGFRVRGVRLLNGTAVGLSITDVAGNPSIYPENGWVEDVYIYNFSGPGVAIGAGAEITVSAPVIDTCATLNTALAAVRVQAAAITSTGRNIKLIDPIVRNCGGSASAFGILFDGNSSPNWTENEVVGGSIDAQTGNGFGYRDVGGLQVVGLNINAASQAGVSRLAGTVVGVTGLLLDGVRVKSAGLDGFYLNGDSGVSLNGCIARSCGRDGVRLDGASNSTAILGGAFTGNTGYGVREAGGAVTNSYVWGCVRTGNTAGPQLLPGQNAVCDGSTVIGSLTLADGTTNAAIPHGLGMMPQSVAGYMKCLTAEHGYNVGDTVTPVSGHNNISGSTYGIELFAVAGNPPLYCGYTLGGGGVSIIDRSTNNPVLLTPANWSLSIVCKGYP